MRKFEWKGKEERYGVHGVDFISCYPCLEYIDRKGSKYGPHIDVQMHPHQFFNIPSSLAKDKTTNFKISMEMDRGKLMFKVNLSFFSDIL